MTSQVLDVGNCDYDHNAIATMLQLQFDAQVSRAHTIADALKLVESQSFDLVLVNRILDRDGSEGLELIQAIRRDPRWNDVPVMMVTNLADHQQRAVEAGGIPGFGKATLSSPATIEALRPFLSVR